MADEFYTPDTPARPRATVKVKGIFTTLIILGLLGVVGYLLAERNHRTYSVVRQGNSLVVMRGLMLPFGSEAYQPTERVLAEAYASIPILNDSPGDLLNKTYSDRDELDRELFRTLATWIGARLTADDPQKLKEAVVFLRRAEKLNGITEDERRQLDDMRAEAGFYEGRAKLDEGLEALSDALQKLELAAGSKSRHAREAGALLLQVQEPVRAAIRASRVAPTAASLLVPALTPPPMAETPTPSAQPAAPPAASPSTPAPVSPSEKASASEKTAASDKSAKASEDQPKP